MDEILNLLHSPAFWFTNLVAVILAIVANRLDRQIPPFSMAWIKTLLWIYALASIPLTVHGLVHGYPAFFNPNPERFSRFSALPVYWMNILIALWPAGTVLWVKQDVSERAANTVAVIFAVLILYATAGLVYLTVKDGGWNAVLFDLYGGLLTMVGTVGLLAAGLVALIFGIAGAVSRFLKRAKNRQPDMPVPQQPKPTQKALF
jgi:hypothetical protein